MRLAKMAIMAVILVAVASPAGAVEQVPAPSLSFERLCLPVSEARLRYYDPFTATDPVLATGRRFLKAYSSATLAVPQTEWFLAIQRMETELLTCEEAHAEWEASTGVVEWRNGRFAVAVTLYGDDLDDLLTPPLGYIQRFILETSTGERLVGEPLIRPNFDMENGRFRAFHFVGFDRRRAFAPGVEWLRLHVATSTSRMYFEWRFAEPLSERVGDP